ncbi:hypothetical protein AVEN_205776-1 [Araneus ventricosus]|uniref:Uncharacterized protein n=1 Tax=Araneus ventricosus TaxID=182803 RepID=A0A4Y2IX76_ARAVE|nr:hypothetical protein AVEN_205776-1 [Araneus ventricosus]
MVVGGASVFHFLFNAFYHMKKALSSLQCYVIPNSLCALYISSKVVALALNHPRHPQMTAQMNRTCILSVNGLKNGMLWMPSRHLRGGELSCRMDLKGRG